MRYRVELVAAVTSWVTLLSWELGRAEGRRGRARKLTGQRVEGSGGLEGWSVRLAEVYRVIGKASSHHLPFIIKDERALSIPTTLS